MFTDQASSPNRVDAGMPMPNTGARVVLTVREREVLGLAGQGLSNKGIAQALGISSGTVTWHLKNCYQKYGVSTREQALRQGRLQAQIKALGTSVCACGRVHTLWAPTFADDSMREGEQK
jgi:ATP/maltotriose-dependent transcriptional regulator MalT